MFLFVFVLLLLGEWEKWWRFCQFQYTFSAKRPRFRIFKISLACVTWNFWPHIHIQHPNFSLIANFQDLSVSNSNFMRLTNLRIYKGLYVSLCYAPPSVVDTARSTTSFHTCLCFAIFSWSLISMHFVFLSLSLITRLIVMFSRSFSINLIHVTFCHPLGFLQIFFASFSACFAGAFSESLKRWPYQFSLRLFTALLHDVRFVILYRWSFEILSCHLMFSIFLINLLWNTSIVFSWFFTYQENFKKFQNEAVTWKGVLVYWWRLMSRSIPTLTILQAARGSTKISYTNAEGPEKLFFSVSVSVFSFMF